MKTLTFYKKKAVFGLPRTRTLPLYPTNFIFRGSGVEMSVHLNFSFET